MEEASYSFDQRDCRLGWGSVRTARCLFLDATTTSCPKITTAISLSFMTRVPGAALHNPLRFRHARPPKSATARKHDLPPSPPRGPPPDFPAETFSVAVVGETKGSIGGQATSGAMPELA